MTPKSLAVAASVLGLSFALAAPSEARTAYQHWAQGHGAYVSSTDHPPFEFQEFLVGASPAYPAPAYGYNPGYLAQPYGYGPGYDIDEPGY